MASLLWGAVELRVGNPLIDLRMMARRGVWTANLVALLIGMAVYGSFSLLPQMNQVPSENGYGFGVTATEACYMMLSSAIASFLSGASSARLLRIIGPRALIAIGSIASSVSAVLVITAHSSQVLMYVAAAFTGFGTGFVFASLANAIVANVPSARTGVAAGMNANIRTVGGALGTASPPR